MKSIGFGEGVLVALLAAPAGAMTFALLAGLVPPAAALMATLTVLGGAYSAYLIVRSRARSGRLVLPLLWLVAAFAVWLAAPGPAIALFVHGGLIWLIRAWTCHHRVLTVLLDLVLSCAAALAAVTSLRMSHSLALAIWSYFLLQALFVWLVPLFDARQPMARAGVDAAFNRALRQAEAAVRRMHRSS